MLQGEIFTFGVFELDTHQRELRKKGRRVQLQDQPFELLRVLIERRGELVSRDELHRILWPADTFVVFDDGLNTAVRKVRYALGDTGGGSRFIETIPRRGYRFIAPTASASAVAASHVTKPTEGLPATTRRLPRLASTVGIAVLCVTFAGVSWLRRSTLEGTPRVQFQVTAPDGLMFPNGGTSPLATLSPDGRQLVFITETSIDRTYQLWVQDLESGTARMLPGTENAWGPFWSPDGTRVGFLSSGSLRIVDVRGTREPQPIADLHDDAGASWGANGDIVFGNGNGGLSRTSVGRGRPVVLTTPDHAAGERRHLWPQILPDGRRFLYFAQYESAEQNGVFLSSLDSPQTRRRVLVSPTTAIYAPPGYLLYVTGDTGTLVAQRIDLDGAHLEGPAVRIASGVAVNYANGRVRFSTSNAGVLAYSGESRAQILQPVWFDRSGRRFETPVPADHYTQLELSPDGRYVAAERYSPDDHEPDILVSDLDRRVTWRATDNPANDESPIWSADSKRFLYARHDGIMQPAQIVEHAVAASQDERTVYRSADSKHPVDWSADGRFILYKVTGMTRKSDIWMVSASGHQEPVPLLATEADEIDARLSRDGRLLAYVSDESGRFEVYVTPFHSPGERWLVSSAGGAQPRWRADGQELIYISSGKEVMSVRVHSGAPFSADAPRALFSLDRIVPEPFTRVPYTMNADAQRFLVGTLVREPASSPISVMINWAGRVDAGTSVGAAHR